MHTQSEQKQYKYCRNCGAELIGDFCHECGQEKYKSQHLTVKFLLYQFIDTIFNFESKFWKSFFYVIVRPGFLTIEYISGRIVPYLMPFKLLMFVMFVTILIDPDNSILPEKFTDNDDIVKNIIGNIMEIKNVDYGTFRESFNSAFSAYSAVLYFSFIFIFAVPMKLFFINTKRLYAEHLVFSVHFFVFVMISMEVFTLIEDLIGYEIILLVFPVQYIYLLIAMKKVYAEKWLITIGESALLFILYFMVLMIGYYAYMFIIGVFI